MAHLPVSHHPTASDTDAGHHQANYKHDAGGRRPRSHVLAASVVLGARRAVGHLDIAEVVPPAVSTRAAAALIIPKLAKLRILTINVKLPADRAREVRLVSRNLRNVKFTVGSKATLATGPATG